jgi:hypothetical protein
MKYMSLLAVALLTGCTTQHLQPLPVEVKIPVAVSCIKPDQVPAKPEYESLKDDDKTPDGILVLHVARDFAKSLSYQTQLEALVQRCS